MLAYIPYMDPMGYIYIYISIIFTSNLVMFNQRRAGKPEEKA